MTTDVPMIVEINCETGEETIRPFNEDELAQRAKDIADYEAMRAQAEEKNAAKHALKESAKAKLVSGQPLTPEEAATIVI